MVYQIQQLYIQFGPSSYAVKISRKETLQGAESWTTFVQPTWKNPGDLWDLPNGKSNHVEKSEHPCQFPAESIERLVFSLSNEGDCVLDPFLEPERPSLRRFATDAKASARNLTPSMLRSCVTESAKSWTGLCAPP